MGFAAARLRATTSSGLAVALLLSVTSTALAAPVDIVPSEITALVDMPSTSPLDLIPAGGQSALLRFLTPPTFLITGSAHLAAPAPAVTTAAARLIKNARTHLGARHVHSAKGPRTFDCIGLVLRSYADSGLISKVGGWSNGSGYSLYAWARRHHLASTTHGQPGDVVVWGGGGHVGIYLGNGMAISALVTVSASTGFMPSRSGSRPSSTRA